MKPQAFKKMNIETKINKLQENISLKFDQFDAMPFAKGNYLESVAISTSDTSVNHGLGVTPIGFIILDKNANATVWRSGTSTDKVLTLRASASVTINLWVF